jgi:hypothetical protein
MKSERRWNRECQTWKLGTDVTVNVPVRGVTHDDKHMAITDAGSLTVKDGYAWNGCSPKVSIVGMVFGTPEGVFPDKTEKDLITDALSALNYDGLEWHEPRTYWASLVHDSLYQLSELHAANMSRRTADVVFLDLLKACRFPRARLYYLAVRIFGGLFWGDN